MFCGNPVGTWTLFKKEVHRFLKVYNQTLFAPVINALLFLAVFNLALGSRVHTMGDVSFGAFMASGLIMMSVMQNAFANTSSSFTMGKILGTLIDYLMPPLSSGEIVFSMTMAAAVRGVMVGTLVGLASWIFIPLTITAPAVAFFYLLSASVALGLLGLLAGIFAESFDQMSAFTSYVITPLAFLSGTFYSVENLPAFWREVTHWNPFFYMIDGFRYGMTGYHDGNLLFGALYIIALVVALWLVVHALLKKGYRVKS